MINFTDFPLDIQMIALAGNRIESVKDHNENISIVVLMSQYMGSKM